MDAKANLILKHYKLLIEARQFDEFDILGFLIFIRSYIPSGKYQYIREFSDLIAHRRRDKGVVMGCIKNAIRNSYALRRDGKKVNGYSGMNYSTWEKQWKSLGKDLGIDLDSNVIIQEMSVCIFSLAQFSRYSDGEVSGKVLLCHSEEKELGLCTVEDNPDAPYVCFATCGPFENLKLSSGGLIREPVETFRDNESGILHLGISNNLII